MIIKMTIIRFLKTLNDVLFRFRLLNDRDYDYRKLMNYFCENGDVNNIEDIYRAVGNNLLRK